MKITQATFSIEFSALPNEPLAAYELGGRAPVIPRIGERVAVQDKPELIDVTAVLHRIGKLDSSTIHHHVMIFGKRVTTDD